MAKITAVKKPKIASIAKNIVVDAKTFKAALEMGIAERKTTIPILSNVLFEPHGKTLRLVTTDLDEMVITELDAVSTVKEPFTLPWRKVMDLLKGEDGFITFTPLENHWVKMSTGGVEYKLSGMAATNYPAHPTSAEIPKPMFQIPGTMLKEMVTHTKFCISVEETRYTLNGALFRFMTDAFLICATDGHRLGIEKRELALSVDGETKNAIVRAVALSWLQKQIGKDNVGISLDADALRGTTVFHLPHLRTAFFTRKLTGQFPNYEAIMPTKMNSVAAFVSADALHKLVTKVAQCSDERSGAIRIHLNGNVTLSASSIESGEAKAVVPEAVVKGGEVVIGLNSGYVLDVLKIAGKNVVTLSLKDSQSAGMFEIPEYPGFAYVVMPMRL